MQYSIELKNGKKVYFASDVHLGLYPLDKSALREKHFVKWMDSIKSDAQVLFLLGDIFDFWHEYKRVIPKGFTRFLGKLCEFTDMGIEVHIFTGNHDIWMYDYLPSETGVVIHRKPIELVINNKLFFLGHGDGLVKAERGYLFLKSMFTNKILQWCFARLHPNLAMWFGLWWSKSSRLSKGISENFLGDDKEFQIIFARQTLTTKHYDYFVFGHRHLAMDYKLNNTSRLLNLGEWIYQNSYAEFNGTDIALRHYAKL
jgi:UDP-2,3-diacylglucosamine hydrolase